MPPRKKRSASKYTGDDSFVVAEGSEPEAKRTKTRAKAKSTTLPPKELGKKFKDDEGNSYWELGGRLRRVTVSKFKGNVFVNIREHYEKDGKVLPGKKGISLNAEQFSALVSVLPQIETCLADENIEISRPVYSGGSLEGAVAVIEEAMEAGEMSEEGEEDEGGEDDHPSHSSSIQQPQIAATATRTTCNVCNKTFSDRRNLRRHILTVKDEDHAAIAADLTSVVCKFCGEEFTKRESLTKHVKRCGVKSQSIGQSEST